MRMQETVTGTKYLYDLDKVVLERDGAGNLVARYTHEGGSLYHDLVSMKRGGARYYFLFDGLGSVTEVVDGSENTQNSYRYEAWGQVQSSTENVTNPYRYIGAYGVHWDAAPALYFMQARYYAPDIGRFITVDPVRGAPQDPRSLHRYLYVGNNSVKFADPSGLQWYNFLQAPFVGEVIGGIIWALGSATSVSWLSWLEPVGIIITVGSTIWHGYELLQKGVSIVIYWIRRIEEALILSAEPQPVPAGRPPRFKPCRP